MNEAPVSAAAPTTAQKLERALIAGDLAQLSETERLSYDKLVCEAVGLNPVTKPFQYVRLGGRLVLYATRECAEQLRALNGVSLCITDRQCVDDVYVVTARAENTAGRADEATGAVSLAGLNGEARANAMMKAETKAKRRVTLSICGMGLLDESEARDVGDLQPVNVTPPRSITNDEVLQLTEWLDAAGRSAEKLCGFFGVRCLEELSPEQYGQARQMLASYVATADPGKGDRE